MSLVVSKTGRWQFSAMSIIGARVYRYQYRPSKRFSTQYSLWALLLCIGGCAFLAGMFTVGFPAALVLFVAEMTIAFAAVELLMRNLPTTITKAMDDNSYRIDGSFSPNRSKIERNAKSQTRRNLIIALALILAPANFLLFAVHEYVIPLPLGFEAISHFEISPDEWKEELKKEGTDGRYQAWQSRVSRAGVPERTHRKRLLFHSWPVVVGFVACWIVGSFLVFRSVYMSALKDLVSGIRRRSHEHEMIDFSRME